MNSLIDDTAKSTKQHTLTQVFEKVLESSSFFSVASALKEKMERLIELTYSIQSVEKRITVIEQKQIELEALVGSTLDHVQSVRFCICM